jgi:hypothetical protein
MRNRWIWTAVAVALLAAVAGTPVVAEEQPAPVTAPAEQPVVGADLFLPDPEYKYGIIFPGPCTVSVPCEDGSTVQCSGQTRCTWFYGNPGPGFVECDGRRTTCPLN